MYILLLLLYTTFVHAYMYQSNMPTYQPQTRFGYTTNYSNGQFTPSAYQNFNASTIGSTYSGTYNPYTDGNASGSRHGQPRMVKGYDSNGNVIGDDSPEKGTGIFGGQTFWEDGYEYFYDEKEGCWYRRDKNGNYDKWNNVLGWHWSIFYGHNPSNPLTPGYQNNPVPIGEPITPFLILMFAYLSYQEIKRRRERKHFFIQKNEA